MPLVNLRDILSGARRDAYAVGAFDVVNAEYATAIARAAEEEKSPVILMVLEGYLRYFDLEVLVSALIRMARRSRVPVAVHLDHATQWDTLVRSVKAGCSSVMIDCSTAPYEENVARTLEVVKLCKPLDVSVESEIGSVGGSESVGKTTLTSSEAEERYFSDVDEAVRFAAETGVDALAISVGNIHGLYRGKPRLDLGRIKTIAARAGIPLVLHGGSGLSDDDFRNAVRSGMCKININTHLVMTGAKRLKDLFESSAESLNFPELLLSSYEAVRAEAAHFMRVFGCAGRA